MDLIRQLLLDIERTPANEYPVDPSIEGYDEPAVLEHLEMLVKARFVEGVVNYSGIGGHRVYLVQVESLSWSGHDFLEHIRNDTVWQNTKRTVVEKGGAMSLEIISAIAAGFAKSFVGLPPG